MRWRFRRSIGRVVVVMAFLWVFSSCEKVVCLSDLLASIFDPFFDPNLTFGLPNHT